MSLKMIFTPFAILIAIIISIWYIWPLVGEIQIEQKAVEMSKNNLAATINKKGNSEKLRADLDKNKDKEDFILNYLPGSSSEDKMIDGINYLATDSGLSLINISIEKEKITSTETTPASDTLPGANPTIINNSAGTSLGVDPSLIAQKPKINSINVKATVYGKYDSLKIFLNQIYKMEMFNKINSVSISKAQTESSGGETVGDDVLAADIEIKFGYLPPIHGNGNNPSAVFSKSSFDYSSYSKITNLIARKIPALDEGQKGKSNPFLP
jgi:hypothetical protein